MNALLVQIWDWASRNLAFRDEFNRYMNAFFVQIWDWASRNLGFGDGRSHARLWRYVQVIISFYICLFISPSELEDVRSLSFFLYFNYRFVKLDSFFLPLYLSISLALCLIQTLYPGNLFLFLSEDMADLCISA